MLNFQQLKTTKCYGVTALWRCADLLKTLTPFLIWLTLFLNLLSHVCQSSQYPISSNRYSYSVPIRLSGSYHLRYSMM